MELDDRKPQNGAIAVDPQVERGTAEIEVVADATPPPTIKEVTFIAGITKVNDTDFEKAEQEGKTIKGVSPDGGRSWTGKIKIPADVANRACDHRALQDVTGVTELYTTDTNIIDAAAAAKDKAKAAMGGIPSPARLRVRSRSPDGRSPTRSSFSTSWMPRRINTRSSTKPRRRTRELTSSRMYP